MNIKTFFKFFVKFEKFVTIITNINTNIKKNLI